MLHSLKMGCNFVAIKMDFPYSEVSNNQLFKWALMNEVTLQSESCLI